jgi:hypothetical protein
MLEVMGGWLEVMRGRHCFWVVNVEFGKVFLT